MSWLLTIPARRPAAVLLAVLALTVFSLSQIVDFSTGKPLLRVDPALDRLIADEGPETIFYEGVRKRFGNDESIVLAVVAADVFQRPVLASIARMTDRLQKDEAVRGVLSLATAPNLQGADGEIDVSPFVTSAGEPTGDPSVLRQQALDSPIYGGNLVSVDGRATAVLLHLKEIPETQFSREGIDQRLLAIAMEEKGDAEVYISGAPRVKAETSRALLKDLRFIVPAAILMAAIVALISFRSMRGVFVPLTTILIALLWTLGAMAGSGKSLNLVTTILPPLLLSIGFAYTVHVLSAYFEAIERGVRKGQDGEGPVKEAVEEVGAPLALTAITTAAGFLSLAISPIGAIQEFGIFAAIGTFATALATFTFTPAMLQVLSIPKRAAAAAQKEESGWMDAWLEKIALFDVKHRNKIFAATAALVAVALYGITQINVSNNLIQNFLEGAPVRVHFEVINQELGGANSFHVVLEGNERDAFKEPTNLALVESLQAWIEEQPQVGTATSIADHIKTIHWAFHDGDPATMRIPDSAAMTDQLLFFGATEEMEAFVDSRYQMTRILVRARTSDSAELRDLFAAIQERLDEILPEHLSGQPTGNVVLVNKAIDDIARGQAQSLSVAFVAIYIIVTLLFASLRIGLLALLPNAIPVLVYFGAMGLFGVDLNTITGLVACIVLGIAVDDTIHYMTRFSQAARANADETLGTVEALKSVGRPVTYTSVGLVLGFLTLTQTNLQSFIDFGALSSFTLFFAWLLDLTVTPALCSRIRIVNLWDMLTLDLGPDLQQSIRLFSGLSPAQARAVALMTDIRTFPKGETLMRTGEEGDDMFVVIDGELAVTVEQNGQAQELNRLKRGDVVGEVAVFQSHGQRSADVTVREDARLISLDRSSLDRLTKRYPRIAAIVLRNLAEVLAGRVAQATDRMRA